MRLRTTVLLAALIAMPSLAQTTTLTALRDMARPLLIFAGANDPRAQQQLADLAEHSSEVRDRDMRIVVMDVVPHPERHDSALPMATFAPDEEAYARQRFHVDLNEFAVVLVGKDGGEKLHSSNPISWQKLASTVDGMPMRKNEIKQR